MIASVARTAAIRSVPAARIGKSRSLVTATRPLAENHPVWSPGPFPKLGSAILVFGVAGAGVIIPLWSVRYQNKKHGFSK
mmetsp:Transcript_14725/g.23951  ORF Transcript_14725/g.23951 Transcript_14725/m.23951 type:complete len:80 (+) Transcript_14725:56-295(+)